jgi:hypothetical protein
MLLTGTLISQSFLAIYATFSACSEQVQYSIYILLPFGQAFLLSDSCYNVRFTSSTCVKDRRMQNVNEEQATQGFC